MKRLHITIIIVAVVLFAVVAAMLEMRKPDASLSEANGLAIQLVTELPPPTPPPGWIEYRNSESGFSLFHPPGIVVRELEGKGGTKTITFEDPGNGVGFQVFIVPYPGEEISEARFLQDVPSGVRKEPTNAAVGGVKAVAFYSKHAVLGETREIWFLHGGHLFEVTTIAPLDAWLADIMGMWRFL